MVEVYLVKAALFVIFLLCILGIFSPRYHENWLQFTGMAIIAIGVFPLAKLIHERGWVSPEATWILVGFAVFGVGMAVKVWRHRKDPISSKQRSHA